MLSALAMTPDEMRVPTAIMMALLIGLIQIAITLLRMGDLSRYVSHAVIVGFTLGAATLLVLDQMKNLLGLPAVGGAHDQFLVRFFKTIGSGHAVHIPTVCIGVGTIAIAVGLRWTNRRFRLAIPEFLSAIVTAAVVSWVLGLSAQGVQLVDQVPRSLPAFRIPHFSWDMAREMMSSATIIALLGLLEAVAMAKSLAARTGDKLDMNQLCFSEGIANSPGVSFSVFRVPAR